MSNTMRIMIVGTGSGCGKTTATCGLLMALKKMELRVASFKCGPDYIDPMFHSEVLGIKSKNLDLFMCGENPVKQMAVDENADISIIEGVMGMYDGISCTEEFSSNHLALVLGTPQILVVNPKGMSLSLVALISGYMNYAKNNIQGVILNQVSETMYNFYKNMIKEKLGIAVYGYIPQVEEASLESRHLGLVTASEVSNLKHKLECLGEVCSKTLDITAIIELSKTAAAISYEPIEQFDLAEHGGVKIAVAMDKAFCFYYQDNFELLKKLGAELLYFSPLDDEKLPEDIDCIILGGGYPEEYAKKLSQNKSMLKAVKAAIISGLPTLAECGGYMYLCKEIQDREGNSYGMVNYFDVSSKMTNKLSRFGYITLTANEDNLLCKKNEKINAHEFHYSDSDDNGESFTASKTNGSEYKCIHAKGQVFAGYPHMHLWGNIDFAKRLIQNAKNYRKEKGINNTWK